MIYSTVQFKPHLNVLHHIILKITKVKTIHLKLKIIVRKTYSVQKIKEK